MALIVGAILGVAAALCCIGLLFEAVDLQPPEDRYQPGDDEKGIFGFLRQIPGYYRLYKDDASPEEIRHTFSNYSEVLRMCTGGKLSKINYDPNFAIEEIEFYYRWLLFDDDMK